MRNGKVSKTKTRIPRGGENEYTIPPKPANTIECTPKVEPPDKLV